MKEYMKLSIVILFIILLIINANNAIANNIDTNLYDDNLLPNSSFEEGSGDLPDGWSTFVYSHMEEDWVEFYWDSEESHSGLKSIGIGLKNNFSDGTWLPDDFIPLTYPISDLLVFDFSFWHKSIGNYSESGIAILAGYNFYNENHEIITGIALSQGIEESNEWTKSNAEKNLLWYFEQLDERIINNIKFIKPYINLASGSVDFDQTQMARFDDVYFNMLESYPPEKPYKPEGPTVLKAKTPYTISVTSNEENGDDLYYLYDWGDGRNTAWIGPYQSGERCEFKHKWNNQGSYEIKVKVKNKWDQESDWSPPLRINVVKSKSIDITTITSFIKKPNLLKETQSSQIMNIIDEENPEITDYLFDVDSPVDFLLKFFDSSLDIEKAWFYEEESTDMIGFCIKFRDANRFIGLLDLDFRFHYTKDFDISGNMSPAYFALKMTKGKGHSPEFTCNGNPQLDEFYYSEDDTIRWEIENKSLWEGIADDDIDARFFPKGGILYNPYISVNAKLPFLNIEFTDRAPSEGYGNQYIIKY